ncbi:putative mitochondrial putative lipophosphoglycan biosynthetic protein [Leptomonas pyrrhocoris]|uniref:Endoplasmin homolog n=1 Tax=Leptomonas pyrrhocoris TaxID=157538 RepID=A0A0N0VF86_LEPPY|nr:putative mitochondrial putative lipophosphoglycan biosynthetic protein [Leptomonas pyrrhocoris]XP_015658833.1 putative mitochondrial putative lipophosphoglycan biosynthetic protein [Leptomonas pyrrhocoris]KPA80393.1 putative mitochondrial putative lipophosphoglycan biosynthetic protein [Leptomonas pyrrhocoris]KPA80394.1 putative mitochondrial putative lipophosphoglycan biosynthetic protein [Leptomonas pyrrhocoris]|eukprot:XP_015658832.1 putative mitochondrial putative lipophosphoglycan biosynthetic protein [Leptomonas pyrrhocoris]
MRRSPLLRVALVALIFLGTISATSAGDGRGTPITFQAEVSKMLDILVNSLYTNRAIFLRELISNGSDALDKIRVLYLTAPKEPLNADGVSPTMDIRISFNKEKSELVIRDGGVGMNKDDLAGHLGSLGTSGTKRFLEKLQEGGTAGDQNNLIGQFGVGFYSVFLVGDRVRVASKSDDGDEQYVWESSGNGQYFLYPDPRGNTLGRGTEITIELKPDAEQFLSAETIKKTVHQYSEFINFPIYVEEEVTVEAAKKEDADTEDKALDEDEVEDEVEAVPVTERKWTLVNENRPIWTRPIGNVTEAEYNKFYKAFSGDYRDPLYFNHFRVEGEVEFDSILFVPAAVDPATFSDDNTVPNTNIKLYVRRVFITDEFRDLLPRYLNFVKGIVDSNDLPLNVSREVLQESRILRVIKKKLVRKALTMFSDIAEQDEAIAKGTQSESPAPSGHTHLTQPTYAKFWELFGKHLRLGVMLDSNNRNRLTKLFRYKSSKSDGAYISLQTYVDRMKKGQKGIYYISGDTIERIQKSPMLEDAVNHDVEVIFMTDAIDEYVVAQVTDFAGKKLINLAKEGVQFEETDARQRVIDKKRKEKYEALFTRLRSLFGYAEVRKVILTKRLTNEAFILSSGENQITARLANIMRGQSMALMDQQTTAERVLEVNYRHPLVDEMFKRFAVDEDDAVAMDVAWVLYDTANLQAEFPVADVAAYSRRINRLLRSSVDLAADETLLPPDDAEYAVSTTEAAEEEEGEAAAENANAAETDDDDEADL